MESVDIKSSKFRGIFVLVLVLVTAGSFLAVTWPMLKPLFVAAILSGLSFPLQRSLVKVLRGKRGLAAALTVVIVMMILFGPVSALLALVARQAMGVSEFAIPWLQDNLDVNGISRLRSFVTQAVPWVGDMIPNAENLVASLGAAAQSAGVFLVGKISAITAGTAGFLLSMFVMFYAIFFFLRDGRKIMERILYYIPMQDDERDAMVERFMSITKATVRGTLLIGLIQGTLGGIAFYFAGINGAAFWGAVMVVLSVVPGIGAPLVWIPVVVTLYFSGESLSATLLLIWCAGVVGTIDNVLRPRLVGRDARMPDLLILVGTIGGLYLFGPIGFALGPIIYGLFLTALDFYASAYRHVLSPVKSRIPAPLGDQNATPIAK
jgi:predicted PurR-regulated permease PerM